MLSLKARAMLAQRSLGMVFDIDGTLSPIAPTPDEARLYPGVVAILEQLRERAHLAILTGREIENGAKMIHLEGLTYVGTHGLEWSEGLPQSHGITLAPDIAEYIEPARAILRLAEMQLAQEPGILIEYKHVGGAVHYRLAPNPDEARQKIVALLEAPAAAAHISLHDDKFTVDVRVPSTRNKGQALKQLVRDWDVQAILFGGDSKTDLDAFLALDQLQQEGKAALGIVVQHIDTAPELLEQADIIVQGVEGMVRFLQECAVFLKTLR